MKDEQPNVKQGKFTFPYEAKLKIAVGKTIAKRKFL